jgi:hypothetical protein
VLRQTHVWARFFSLPFQTWYQPKQKIKHKDKKTPRAK